MLNRIHVRRTCEPFKSGNSFKIIEVIDDTRTMDSGVIVHKHESFSEVLVKRCYNCLKDVVPIRVLWSSQHSLDRHQLRSATPYNATPKHQWPATLLHSIPGVSESCSITWFFHTRRQLLSGTRHTRHSSVNSELCTNFLQSIGDDFLPRCTVVHGA